MENRMKEATQVVERDAPGLTQFPIKFKGWDRFGYVITPEKLSQHASHFRNAARLLRGMNRRDADVAAGGLENLAEQYEAIYADEPAEV